MKKLIIFPILTVLFLSACNSDKQTVEKKDDKNIVSAETIKPDTLIKVKKEYDKNGNLIKFDSLYSYYYSNITQDSLLRDSIFNEFKKYFNEKYFFSDKDYFNKLFFEDSLLKYDFYKDDFFKNRYMDNSLKMDKLFKEMDSIKNNFFKEQEELFKKINQY